MLTAVKYIFKLKKKKIENHVAKRILHKVGNLVRHLLTQEACLHTSPLVLMRVLGRGFGPPLHMRA